MSLVTKYITKATVRFDPFGPLAAGARSFLALLPHSAKLDLKVLPPKLSEPTLIEVTFKDKNVLKADPLQVHINDIADLFNAHSRKLAINDAVNES